MYIILFFKVLTAQQGITINFFYALKTCSITIIDHWKSSAFGIWLHVA